MRPALPLFFALSTLLAFLSLGEGGLCVWGAKTKASVHEQEALPSTTEKAISPLLPQWQGDDQNLMFQGEWFAGEELLPSESEPADEQITEILAEIDPTQVSPGPPTHIDERLHALYLPQSADQRILDPQNILASQESTDLAQLLKEIEDATGAQIFLTVFYQDQPVPANLNAPPLARHVLKNKLLSVLIQYHKDRPGRTSIIFSEDLAHVLNDKGKLSLLEAIRRQAGDYSEDTDYLWTLIESLGHRLPPLIHQAKTDPMARPLQVPLVNYDLSKEEIQKPSKLGDLLIKLKELWLPIASFVYWSLGIIAFLLLAPYVWSKTRRVKIPEHTSKTRLHAPHGTGTTRVLFYSGGQITSKKEKDFLKDLFR